MTISGHVTTCRYLPQHFSELGTRPFGRAEFAHWKGNCSYALCQTVADTTTRTRGMQLLPSQE